MEIAQLSQTCCTGPPIQEKEGLDADGAVQWEDVRQADVMDQGNANPTDVAQGALELLAHASIAGYMDDSVALAEEFPASNVSNSASASVSPHSVCSHHCQAFLFSALQRDELPQNYALCSAILKLCASDLIVGHGGVQVRPKEALQKALEANRRLQARLREIMGMLDKAIWRNAQTQAKCMHTAEAWPRPGRYTGMKGAHQTLVLLLCIDPVCNHCGIMLSTSCI